LKIETRAFNARNRYFAPARPGLLSNIGRNEKIVVGRRGDIRRRFAAENGGYFRKTMDR
jgi:hypothetical protein